MSGNKAAHSVLARAVVCALGWLAAMMFSGPTTAADSPVAGSKPSPAKVTAIQPNPLLSIDQNRTTVVDRVVTAWGDALVGANAGLSEEQLRSVLLGLRSDQLLAASLAGSLEGLRNVLANALTSAAPIANGLIQTKALGDTADDLVYTPVVPCRIVDTRNAGGAFAAGGETRNYRAFVTSGTFAAQGGAASNCVIPANPAAVAINITTIGGGGFLTAWPYNTAQPQSSTLNPAPGQVLANGALVPTCQPNCAAEFSVFTFSANLVIDIVGYLKAPNSGNIGIGGNLTLVHSTAAAGNVMKGTTRFIHDYGTSNTFVGALAGNFTLSGMFNSAVGTQALFSNTTGGTNAASGAAALYANTTGSYNTATGSEALLSNTTGMYNTASGWAALSSNTVGGFNTADGIQALFSNTSGTENTASGVAALFHNTTGIDNAAGGAFALFGNTTGSLNTASGAGALQNNTTGSGNSASGYKSLFSNSTAPGNSAAGYQALYSNTIGQENMAAGYEALYANTGGDYNVAMGSHALYSNTTAGINTAIGHRALANKIGGEGNIALGVAAGYNVMNGEFNIHIGNSGADESHTTRIGNSLQTRTFISGIRGITTGINDAVAVMIDSSGQLGTASSSRRVKVDIADMDDSSGALKKLRPVTFHYKTDHNRSPHRLQYGLIAEEVAQVYPGLVTHSADGRIETVMYQFLPPMLLNEYQKQQRVIEAQAAEISRQAEAMGNQTARIVELEKQATEVAMLKQDRLVQTARIDALEEQASAMMMHNLQMQQVTRVPRPSALPPIVAGP